MIQRIQSLLLVLSVVCISTYLFLPIGSLKSGELTLSLDLFEVNGGELPLTATEAWMVLVPLVLVLVNHLVAIFSFKNRKRQMLLVRLNYFLLAALLVGTMFFIDANVASLGSANMIEESYDIAAFSPLVALILNLIAYRGIKKDEDLIKSLDRLR